MGRGRELAIGSIRLRRGIGLTMLHNEDCLTTMARLESNSIDTIFADLPFYQEWQDEIDSFELKGNEKKIKNYQIWNEKLSVEFYRILKDGGNLILVNAPKYIYYTVHLYSHFTFRNDIPLLRKGSLRPAWMLGFRHNIMLLLVKGSKKLKWYGATKNHDKSFPTDVWDDIPYQAGYRGKGKDFHPEAINYEVVARALSLTTQSGDTLYDPCAGSGTSAIYAGRNDINFIGSELSEKYYQLAIRRINKELDQT